MTAADYDAWYDTPRGRWIGEREWALVRDALQLQAQDSVLDVAGVPTGYGSAGFAKIVPAEHAFALRRLLDASTAPVAEPASRITWYIAT